MPNPIFKLVLHVNTNYYLYIFLVFDFFKKVI